VTTVAVALSAASATIAGVGDTSLDATPGPDRIVGTTGADRIHALAGGDRVRALAGNDWIAGGRGDDILRPGRGQDWVRGGPDSDVVHARDNERDVVRCGPGLDRLGADDEDLVARDCERVQRGIPQRPPPVFLVSRAGAQRSVQQTFCVSFTYGGMCADGPDLEPRRLSVGRPGERIGLLVSRTRARDMIAARTSLACGEPSPC
jgi:RTX calcium-binding nonapeptide repeat (4 copies)